MGAAESTRKLTIINEDTTGAIRVIYVHHVTSSSKTTFQISEDAARKIASTASGQGQETTSSSQPAPTQPNVSTHSCI